jgi:hypothetical protein
MILDRVDKRVPAWRFPAWFKIDTPIGQYNPDCAFVTERDAILGRTASCAGSPFPVRRCRPQIAQQEVACPLPCPTHQGVVSAEPRAGARGRLACSLYAIIPPIGRTKLTE